MPAIGPGLDDPKAESLPDSADAADLYRLLEDDIIPLWRKNEAKWTERMLHAVRLASFFNTNRMMEEYADKAYRLTRGDAWVAKTAASKGGKANKKS